MKELPYFFMLLKKNMILWTIISTNSFSNIDLSKTPHHYWTDKCLELMDYSINKDEKFESIKIIIVDSHISIDFHTFQDKYFEETKFYFGDQLGNLSFQDFIKSSKKQIKLGSFDIGLSEPANVTLTKYGGEYGNFIGLMINR